VTAFAVWAMTLVAILTGTIDRTAWPQWGGPTRTFVVDARELATSWPAGGPRRLWQRPLGEGYSPIVTDGRTLLLPLLGTYSVLRLLASQRDERIDARCPARGDVAGAEAYQRQQE
jgi:hypothetical protein